MTKAKISIRFFDDREVRALWDEENSKWWFSVLDIVAVLTDQNDYAKTRNYWKYLKAKLKKENSQVVSVTTQLKLLAPDGKKRLSDMLDYKGIIALGKEFPGKKANRFIDWFTFSDESIDGKSKTKAYALFEKLYREVCDLVRQGHEIPEVCEPKLLKHQTNHAVGRHYMKIIKQETHHTGHNKRPSVQKEY